MGWLYMPFAKLVADMQRETPGFRVVQKDTSRFMKVLNWVMRPINKTFMTEYTTTIGKTVYMPASIIGTVTGYEVLRHERVHILDAQRWWLLMPLSYLFLLPSVVTMRAYWEFRGYEETLKVWWEEHGRQRDASGAPVLYNTWLDYVIAQFTGPAYLWMFPFPKTLRKAFIKASKRWT